MIRTSRRAGLGVLLCAAALAAGCGSDGGSGGGGGHAPGAGADNDYTAFAECMREHGIDVPDPGADGNRVLELGDDVSPKQMEEARKACGKHVPGLADASKDPEQAAEIQDRALRYAECMRKQGLDFPDPKVEGGRVQMHPGPGFNPDDPATQQAQKRCQGLLQVTRPVEGGQP